MDVIGLKNLEWNDTKWILVAYPAMIRLDLNHSSWDTKNTVFHYVNKVMKWRKNCITYGRKLNTCKCKPSCDANWESNVILEFVSTSQSPNQQLAWNVFYPKRLYLDWYLLFWKQKRRVRMEQHRKSKDPSWLLALEVFQASLWYL